ncbi:unnamed protein product [Orchesella dallaii]|uniref:UBA domain-containing protein n=1 Tax=Orchesella dallaii TaxID=48710 RepID=A0ABP1QXN4_9HEXA
MNLQDVGGWSHVNNSLQALALSPRSETPESRGDSRSPGTTPRDSPRVSRKILHQQEMNLRLGFHQHKHQHHQLIKQDIPVQHHQPPTATLIDLSGDMFFLESGSRSVTPGIASNSTSGIGSSSSSTSGSGGTVAIGAGSLTNSNMLGSAASSHFNVNLTSPVIPIIPPPLPPRKTSPSRKRPAASVNFVDAGSSSTRITESTHNDHHQQAGDSNSSVSNGNDSSSRPQTILNRGEAIENGYDVPSTVRVSSSSISASSSNSSSSQNQHPSQAPSSSNKSHGGRPNTNKALELIHQQQQQLRHQSCPAISGSNALHLSTPKSCPSSAAVSPNCNQHTQLPSNSSSKSSSAHGKSMPNCLALSSITSCCVMATGNKQFLPRHSLHPQATGKTPSSSFSTRVVANKSSSSINSASSSSAAISSRKGPISEVVKAQGSVAESSQQPKGNLLGISMPFKGFPISAKIGQSNEVLEGPNYENTNIGQISFPPLVSKRVVPDFGASDETPTAPYENINMDYISKLAGEGFSQDLVIRALGISRNDVEMARDILNEFAGSRS